MLYTIKSADASATVSSLGAELQSLRHATSETIWQGDPDVWSGRAPILFPIVGALKDNQYTHSGKSYDLPRHGFARHSEFNCIEQSADSVTLQLQADSSSLAVYPWQFELTIRFSIHQTKQQTRLTVGYTVVNTDATKDTTPMLFTIGSHPAFALPHSPDEYAIHFSKTETLKRYPLSSEGLLLPATDYLQDSQILPLSDSLFDDDALVFKNIHSDTVSLYHRDQPIITVDTGGAPHLGIWAKPAARFVCIEPWFGFSDSADGGGALADKPEMKTLAAGDLFTCEWDIALHKYGPR